MKPCIMDGMVVASVGNSTLCSTFTSFHRTLSDRLVMCVCAQTGPSFGSTRLQKRRHKSNFFRIFLWRDQYLQQLFRTEKEQETWTRLVMQCRHEFCVCVCGGGGKPHPCLMSCMCV